MVSLKDVFIVWRQSQKEDFLSMSGHGTNLVFFNKKKKDWTLRTHANPAPPIFDNISFLPYPATPIKEEGICALPLMRGEVIFYLAANFSLTSFFEN